MVQGHLDTYLAFVDIETGGAGLPTFVTDEFDAFLALKLIAAIEESAVIQRILTYLGLAAQPPPRAPARRMDLLQAA